MVTSKILKCLKEWMKTVYKVEKIWLYAIVINLSILASKVNVYFKSKIGIFKSIKNKKLLKAGATVTFSSYWCNFSRKLFFVFNVLDVMNSVLRIRGWLHFLSSLHILHYYWWRRPLNRTLASEPSSFFICCRIHHSMFACRFPVNLKLPFFTVNVNTKFRISMMFIFINNLLIISMIFK